MHLESLRPLKKKNKNKKPPLGNISGLTGSQSRFHSRCLLVSVRPGLLSHSALPCPFPPSPAHRFSNLLREWGLSDHVVFGVATPEALWPLTRLVRGRKEHMLAHAPSVFKVPAQKSHARGNYLNSQPITAQVHHAPHPALCLLPLLPPPRSKSG